MSIENIWISVARRTELSAFTSVGFIDVHCIDGDMLFSESRARGLSLQCLVIGRLTDVLIDIYQFFRYIKHGRIVLLKDIYRLMLKKPSVWEISLSLSLLSLSLSLDSLLSRPALSYKIPRRSISVMTSYHKERLGQFQKAERRMGAKKHHGQPKIPSA